MTEDEFLAKLKRRSEMRMAVMDSLPEALRLQIHEHNASLGQMLAWRGMCRKPAPKPPEGERLYRRRR